ncbi:MAG: SpoIIE family protein phosphatase [Bacteroidales bacterium]|nr:SpoIIE family protein phosphatase [Bacteroidales bacterium]
MRKLNDNTFVRNLRRQGMVMVLVAALLLEATTFIQTRFARRGMKAEAERRAESELVATNLKINNITSSVEAAVNNVSWALSYEISRPDSLYGFFRWMLDLSPQIFDLALGFEPDYFPEKGRWFEPVSTRLDDGSYEDAEIGSAAHDYLNMAWYRNAIEKGEGVWSEPYFDDSGGRAMVVTYAVPVRDREGKIAGVFGADVTLDFLKEMVENIQLYPNSYSTIVSQEGQLLAAPAETLSTDRAVRFKTSIEDTGWIMTIVIPESEIYRNVKRTGIWTSLFQLMGLMFLIYIIQRTAKEQVKLKEAEDSNDRIEGELKIARGIQMSMIPKTFPPFPERNDLDVAAAMYPAKEVGGDLYDFYIRDEKLYFCIGDVSGKGVPASLFMAVTRSLFRTISAHEKSPQRIVTAMNDSMTDMNENDMYQTFFCGVLNLVTGHLRYCNAGHNAPLIMKDSMKPLPVLPNLPLGVIKGNTFKEQSTDLSYGDALFLYTDGITEAENSSYDLFGEERLIDALSVKSSSREQLESIKESISEFVGDAPQSDDITMLFIHYMNTANSGESERHLVLHNDIRQIPLLAAFVEGVAQEKKLEQSVETGINLALEEAVTNVIMYAYPKGTDGLIEIDAKLNDKSVEFVISDSGSPFDPTAVPKADTSLGVEDRPIGGLGIFLVRNIMDNVKYARKDGKNILSMTKNI